MSSKDLSKGSLVSVWLLNNMETIIQNQGLQHIVEKSLMCLDKESFNSFGLVNNDFKGITESPRVLRVLKARELASVINGFLLNYDNLDYHFNSEGDNIIGSSKLRALNGDEWKNKLFKFLHDQSLNQVEVDHFKLLCKILNQNLIALSESLRYQNFHKYFQDMDQAQEKANLMVRLVYNSWSEILILDQIHHQMHDHIPDETTLANGQKFELLSLAHLGTPSLLEAFKKMSRKLSNLMFDNADYVCLKLLLLFDPEDQTLRNQSSVQECIEQVRQTLHEYCSYSRVPDKFNQLVNLLPELRDMAQCGVDFLYFKLRQNQSPQNSLLMECLFAKKGFSSVS